MTARFNTLPAGARWVVAGIVTGLALLFAYEAFGWWGVGAYAVLAALVVFA